MRIEGEARRLPPLVENNLLRIGQEAITNASRHARPRRIDVTLTFEGRTVRLAVQDDGVGFAPGTSARVDGRSFGLVGIRERVHLMGGTVVIDSAPGEGTRIVERYVPSEDRLSIDRTMTIYDPYYTQPLVRQRYSARDDAVDLTEQAPCDPDSFYRDLSTNGRLEEHFDRQR